MCIPNHVSERPAVWRKTLLQLRFIVPPNLTFRTCCEDHVVKLKGFCLSFLSFMKIMGMKQTMRMMMVMMVAKNMSDMSVSREGEGMNGSDKFLYS